MAKPSLDDKIRFLRDGAHLGEPDVTIECIETHFAWVFLSAQYAYKLRKPVRHRSLDTLSLESRQARCDEELRLNQVLAPGVYLDVLPLTLAADGSMRLGAAVEPRLEPGGAPVRVVDWLLRMRRLPAARMFDRMIREGSWQSADLQALSTHLQHFYAQSPVLSMSGHEYRDRLGAGIKNNHEELLAAEPFGVDAERVAHIAARQQQWIDAHGECLSQRAERGMIRDCHGDLKPEHVCFGPPVSVIDRLEFDAELRRLDPIEDLCFLWLECLRLGAPSAGQWLVRSYLEAGGEAVPPALADFYLSQRALTRAKVAAWRLIAPDVDRSRWRERVAVYLSLAMDAIHRAS